MKRVFLALVIALMLLTACAQAKNSLGDEILGTWVNSEGYQLQFHSGGSGFIPGVPGKIPDTTFTYVVKDDSHISIDLGGHVQTIEIQISGDQLTWTDDLGEVAYTRVK